MADLSARQYRALLTASLSDAKDADTSGPNSETLFTPDSHRLALDPDVTVVKGARGVGKTVWHRALQNNDLREIASNEYQIGSLRSVRAVSGYGSERQPQRYPGPGVLRAMLADGTDVVSIWTAVLLVALENTDIAVAEGWAAKARWVHENPEALDNALAAADAAAARTGQSFLLLFDALDRLSDRRDVADELVGGILRLALDLRLSTNHLRAKVFIRPDMLTSAHANFPDASKLTANAAELMWSDVNLYALLVHRMGNTEGPLAASFREHTGGWRSAGERRFLPPRQLARDRRSQQELFVGIAGPYMGRNHRKGHTYGWLPNHLMDGAEQVSPRSFLSALSKATEITSNNYDSHEFALHFDGIRTGVQEASRIRVIEISEDIPWVASAVRCLEGTQVPIEPELIAEQWSQNELFRDFSARYGDRADGAADAEVRTGPRARNHSELIAELMSIGVMTRRRDGRIDLPDVYRIAFSIGRKGGVPKTPAAR